MLGSALRILRCWRYALRSISITDLDVVDTLVCRVIFQYSRINSCIFGRFITLERLLLQFCTISTVLVILLGCHFGTYARLNLFCSFDNFHILTILLILSTLTTCGFKGFDSIAHLDNFSHFLSFWKNVVLRILTVFTSLCQFSLFLGFLLTACHFDSHHGLRNVRRLRSLCFSNSFYHFGRFDHLNTPLHFLLYWPF